MPQFSKILEKLFDNIFEKFVEQNKILSDSTYGFRKNISTSLALLEMTKEITNAIDNKKASIRVFTDLKKAFDTVNHNLLIKKLEINGIHGIVFKWLLLGHNPSTLMM